jgi:hypothetical protein
MVGLTGRRTQPDNNSWSIPLTTSNEKPSRRALAVHEAGHAVVGSALGLRILRLWINDIDGGTDTEGELRHLVDKITVCGAGEVATKLLGTPTPSSLASGDHECMLKLTPGSSAEERQHIREQGLRRAHEILSGDTETLRAVAAELEQSGSMDAETFAKISDH